MDRNGLMTVLFFLFMIVLGQSNASNSRKLVTSPDPNGSSNANQDSPSSSPPPDDKKPNFSPVEVTKPNDSPNTSPSNVVSKGLNDANTNKSSEKVLETQLETFSIKSCKGNPICSDKKKTMIACTQDFENGSNNLTLVVLNQQDVDLKVDITSGTFINNYLIPAHGTEKVNITFSGDKSNKIILNAGNGDCELQISQPKTTQVNSPSKSKDPENTPNPKNVNNPADSPVKPKDVSNPADSPVKPKDVSNPADSLTRPKEENSPSKDKKPESPSTSKDVNDPSKLKEVNDPSKSKDINDQSKSKDVNDPSNSKDSDDQSKSKEVDDPSKLKDVDDPTKSMSKDVNDPSKSKDGGPIPNTKTSVNTPISQDNFLDQLTFYSKQVTPIYGAYLAFLVALIVGGSWALCSFRKRRTNGGVPYQELEMGPTESSNAVDVETAEGWDQDWDDDDWDEDKAIRSPGGGIQSKSISFNGLTSRATKKDGWDADWDD